MVLKDVLLLLKERFDWTNEQCADNCGISLPTWKRLIYGELYNPRMETLRLLSKGFGVSVDLLMDERNSYLMVEEERDFIMTFRDLPLFLQDDVQKYVSLKKSEWQQLCSKDYRYRVRRNHHKKIDDWTADEILESEIYIEEKRKKK